MIAALQLRSGRPVGLVSQPQQQPFMAILALLFAASATLTMFWWGSMSSMGVMPMPGGWSMSMMWMRMPEQTWIGASASFLGMWSVMMIAMMLPSLIPILQRYRQAVTGTSETRLNWLTALVGTGYFFVWALFGTAVFPLGVGLATIEMRHPALARAVPVTTGAIIVIAGALQFTQWKVRHLACCRAERDCCHTMPTDGNAWRRGVHLGIQCAYCCATWTAILLVIGMMDLRAMTIVTAAITAERLASNGERMAKALGALAVIAGMFLILRTAF